MRHRDAWLWTLLAVFFVAMSVWAVALGMLDHVAYAVAISLLLGVLFWFRARLGVPAWVAVGFVAHQALNFAGDYIMVAGGVRLYDSWPVPGILHYDNVVHAFGSFFIMLFLWYAMRPHLPGVPVTAALVVLALAAMGTGTIVEMTELWSVIHLNAAARVGDYLNNAFDLVYNMVGALLGCAAIAMFRLRPQNVTRRRRA